MTVEVGGREEGSEIFFDGTWISTSSLVCIDFGDWFDVLSAQSCWLWWRSFVSLIEWLFLLGWNPKSSSVVYRQEDGVELMFSLPTMLLLSTSRMLKRVIS